MRLFAASFVGAIVLVLGRVFGAGREFFLAREAGPTMEMTNYVLASSILLAFGGLLSGVSSAMMVRKKGSGATVGTLSMALAAIGIICTYAHSVLTENAHANIFMLFALALPFYAIYGVANGRLLANGFSLSGMVASAIPPFMSAVAVFLPIGTAVERVTVGHLVGSVIMAAFTFVMAYGRIPLKKPEWKGIVSLEYFAITAVSLVNICSPIIDRLIASGLGPTGLVLLNVGAVLYAGVTGSLGLAMGNVAVSRASVGTDKLPEVPLAATTLVTGLAFLLCTPLFADFIMSGGSYGAEDRTLLLSTCVLFGLAIPCGLLNQVNMRLWNRTAGTRAMVSFAILLMLIKLIMNLLLIGPMGAAGIALSTLIVQIVQCVVLAMIHGNRIASVSVLFSSIFSGGVILVATN